MGHVRFPIREFYDSTSELVGIKSGILLNRFDISRILLERNDDEFLKSDNLDLVIRLGTDSITEMVIQLRQKLGNYPLVSPVQRDFDILRRHAIRTRDLSSVAGLIPLGHHYLRENKGMRNEELAQRLHEEEKIELEVARAVANIALDQEDTSVILYGGTKWDGITPLSKLFDSEVSPRSDEEFVEQKFIDYLAVNGHEIETIHWRNFERFCAEYFRRQGFVVVLGSGGNDGGVDIRVFRENDKNSAPFILIQCKRYNADRKVTIETVKSFYTDVQHEKAETGLIATTGYIATGGKKICQARKYNISFAEKDNVSSWAQSMWRYS